MSDLETLDDSKDFQVEPKKDQNGKKPWLSKSIGCLVCGIVSLAIGPFVYAIPGIVCAGIALSYYNHDKPIYDSDPVAYEKSFKYLKMGRTFAIIGLIVSILFIPLWIMYFGFILGEL